MKALKALVNRENDPSVFRDWSLITGSGGLENGKIAGPKLFVPPLKTG